MLAHADELVASSSPSSTSCDRASLNHHVEEVLQAASGPVWFQLYINKDRGFTRDLVKRVEAAGCPALMLTVDTPNGAGASVMCATAFICRLA